MKRRINIGLLIDDVNNFFSSQAARGAEQAAKALDANLYIFPGHYIGSTDSRYADKKFDFQFNSIFRLPTKRNVDIIYILQGIICSRADMEQQKEFLKLMPDVPVVCLFSSVEGYHSVNFDNKSGFVALLDHLIKEHKARDIGYVSGPVTNRDARERLDIFKSVLKKHKIPFEDNKVVYGNFTLRSEPEVDKLLDTNEHLDAIVFANDSMAVGGYSALKKRGLIPGKDLKITGFDDDAFSVGLEPPLTTVEASSAHLTYKALLNAENYINGTAVKDATVETQFVQRESCGCADLDSEVMGKKLKFTEIGSSNDQFFAAARDYLFGFYLELGSVSEAELAIDNFLSSYASFIESVDKSAAADDMEEKFTLLLNTDLYSITTAEKLFNILQIMQYFAVKSVSKKKEQTRIYEMFVMYFRRLAFFGISPMNSVESKNEKIQGEINRQANDIFLYETEKEIPYEHLLGGLYELGFKRSLLYLFQGRVKNSGIFEWTPPTSILLKAISDEDGVKTLSEEQQLLRTEKMFANEFIPDKKRHTMIVSPLFSGSDLYGYLVNELHPNLFTSVSTVALRLCVNLRSLFMIEDHNKAKQTLQLSIERFIRENNELEAIAQKDELTGLFNRRGFIVNAEKLLQDPVNRDKYAIICYADMDNLKMINDKFGHDDGDFALKTTANILVESFRDTDIVGRFGGDEFITFAVTGTEANIANMKERIGRVTKHHNEVADKPYPIEMSTGIYSFKCSPKVDIYDVINKADELLYDEKIRKKEKNGSYR